MTYTKKGFAAAAVSGQASYAYLRKAPGVSCELWNQTQQYLGPGGSALAYGPATSATIEPLLYDNVVDAWVEAGSGMPNYDFSSLLTGISPALPLTGNGFGVSVRSLFTPTSSGTYSFSTNSDDGSDLWITQQNQVAPGTLPLVTGNLTTGWVQVVNNNYGVGQGATKVTGTVSLTAGVSYVLWSRTSQGSGGGSQQIKWTAPSQAEAYLTDASGTMASPFFPMHMLVDWMPYGHSCQIYDSTGTLKITYVHRSQRGKAMVPTWKVAPLTNVTVVFKDQTGATVSSIPVASLTGGEQFFFSAPGSLGAVYASPSVNKPQGTQQRVYTFDSTTENFTIDTGGSLSSVNSQLRVTKSSAVNATILEPSTAANLADGELVFDYAGVVSSTQVNGSDIFGAVFRATDANNHYMIQINTGIPTTAQSQITLYKKVTGTYTGLMISPASQVNYMPLINRDGPHRFMVRFVGPLISLYVNETFLLSWYDATFTTGRVGLYVFNNGIYNFDNITAYALASNWTALPYTPQSAVVASNLEPVYSANSGTGLTLPDVAQYGLHRITLTGNATITLPPPVAGKSLTVHVAQDGTGGRTLAWATPTGSIKWPSAIVPTVTSTASKEDVYSFLCTSTDYIGFVAGQNF